jgi:EpsD family peptidyl-prolyl cis-trans isomerase
MKSSVMRPFGAVRRTSALPLLAVLASAALLVACGGNKDAGGEVAAKVNKDDITAGHINFVLAQQRNLRPEQTDAASRQVLERLIEQQLFLQKAAEQKLETNPGVQMALDLARREVLSRAYIERLGESAPKPTPEDIKKYYDEKPALFRERRIFNLQEISIESRPEQLAEIRERLAASKNTNEFVEYLKSAGIRFAGNQAVRAAEQLPLASLDSISRMKDGQAMIVPTATGAQVVVLAGSRSQPVMEEQARASIEQFLLTERRRKLVEDDMKALRTAAKIEYQGKYANAAAGAASMPALAASGLLSGDAKKGAATK